MLLRLAASEVKSTITDELQFAVLQLQFCTICGGLEVCPLAAVLSVLD